MRSDVQTIKNVEAARREIVRHEAKLRDRASTGAAYAAFLDLPHLVSFWPGNAVRPPTGATAAVRDATGYGKHLTIGATQTALAIDVVNNLVPFVQTAPTAYYTRASEAEFVWTAALTFGGWFKTRANAAEHPLFGKYDTAANRGYLLSVERTDSSSGAGRARLLLSGDGTAVTALNQANDSFPVETWHFLCGRYQPTLASFYQDDTEVTTPTPPAALFGSTAALMLGAMTAGAVAGSIGAAFLFVCSGYVPTRVVRHLFALSRPLFTVVET